MERLHEVFEEEPVRDMATSSSVATALSGCPLLLLELSFPSLMALSGITSATSQATTTLIPRLLASFPGPMQPAGNEATNCYIMD